jgi:hypothetical protein
MLTPSYYPTTTRLCVSFPLGGRASRARPKPTTISAYLSITQKHMYWILAPYLITVKGLDYDKAYDIIEAWLDKCNEVRRLEPSWTAFRYRLRYCLDTAEDQERRPIRFDTFKNTILRFTKSFIQQRRATTTTKRQE